MMDKITWVRWILYVVALFLPVFIIYTIAKPADKSNRYMCIVHLYLVSSGWQQLLFFTLQHLS